MESWVEDCLGAPLRCDLSVLADRFATAEPFRHVVIDGFFGEAFAAALADAFPAFDEKLALNEDGRAGGKAVHEKLAALGDDFRRLDRLVRTPGFRDLIGTISGIPELQFDPWYFGGGTHENRHGQDLDPHVDFNYHPITRQHRRLNLIVYFERDWAPEWGGALDLHRNPRLPPEDDQVVRVPIAFNRAILFETTETSWHGFERIELPPAQRQRSRRSFALYYYTDERPIEETASPHSTIYVERHLPARFTAGHVLDGTDLRDLRSLLSRRDQHLERLYRQVTTLTERVQQLEAREAPAPASGGQDLSGVDRKVLEARCRLLAEQVAELHGSTSWRVTAPLRGIARLLGRGR